ncbi:Purine permease 3 [Sesamum angolense]|uniref:Probable purine permease n=1 Tax=Sesamum angolense TaxID=2727404 RepID=A0AAE2BYI7_9LAMI|nr:Purine permease 3 [Sesamum angolense]
MEAEAGGRSSTLRKLLLLLNCFLLIVGNCGGPLIMRLYFIKGGKRIWLSSLLQTAGFPLILIPLTIAYACRPPQHHLHQAHIHEPSGFPRLHNHRHHRRRRQLLLLLRPRTAAGLDLVSHSRDAAGLHGGVRVPPREAEVHRLLGERRRPVDGWRSGAGDQLERRPAGGGDGERVRVGVCSDGGGVGAGGFMLPLVELTYAKAKQAVTYTLVLEIQMMMCFFATAFCSVGMLINNDFQAIPKEAKQYELGETKYYLVLFWTTIVLQCFFLGCIGVVFYASSLFSGIVITVSIPITTLLAVIFYHEKFHPEKGVSLFLSLWGFTSYYFGEMKQKKIKNNSVDFHGEQTVQMSGLAVVDP